MKSAKTKWSAFLFSALAVLVSCAAVLSDDGEDYFPVKQNGKFGYIDKTGKIVIPPQFDSVVIAQEQGSSFTEGLAAVQVGDKWGYIDKSGKFVIPPKFKQIFPPSPFHEGLAQVEVKEDKFIDKTGVEVTKETLRFIDRTGKFVKQLNFIEETTKFSEGLAKVSQGDKFGYVDKTGRFVIAARFVDAEDFNEGLAAVRLEDTFEAKYGFIDKTGRMVIQPQFWKAKSFSEGLAAVKTEDNNEGYIDKSGKIVIAPQFNEVYPFSEGLAKVVVGNKIGFIDSTGKMAISLQFDLDMRYISENKGNLGFSDGLAVVDIKNESGYKSGYIDKAGKVIIAPEYDWGSDFHSGVAQVSKGDQPETRKIYYINKTGRIIWEWKAD